MSARRAEFWPSLVLVAIMCLTASMVEAHWSPARARTCPQQENYKAQDANLYAEGKLIADRLFQEHGARKIHPGACDTAKAYSARTKPLKASSESIKEACGKSGVYVTFVEGMSDADNLAKGLLEAYCGVKEEAHYPDQGEGRGWGYRGRILVPVGLLLALLIWLGRRVFR